MDIGTIKHLCAWSQQDLRGIPNMSKEGVVEIVDACHKHGITLRSNKTPTPEAVREALEEYPEKMRLAEAEESVRLKREAWLEIKRAKRKERLKHVEHRFMVSVEEDIYNTFNFSDDNDLIFPKGMHWVRYDPKNPDYLDVPINGKMRQVHLNARPFEEFENDPIKFMKYFGVNILEIREMISVMI